MSEDGTPTSRSRVRPLLAVVAGLSGILLFSAAALGAANAYESTRVELIPPTVVHPWGDDVWDDELAAFLDEYGPPPPREPYTDAERVSALEVDAKLVANAFQRAQPDLPVPDVQFIAVDDAARSACLSGLEYNDGAWDQPMNFEHSPESALIAYTCYIQYPAEPRVRPTDRQLRWHYAFNTTYLAPCLAAHGVTQRPAPTEEFYLANFPSGWWPEYPGMEEPLMQDGFGNDLCPTPDYDGSQSTASKPLPWAAFEQLLADVNPEYPQGFDIRDEFAALEAAGGGRVVPEGAVLEAWFAQMYRCSWLDAGLNDRASTADMDTAMSAYWTFPGVAERDQTGLDIATLEQLADSLGYDDKYETLFALDCASWWKS